MKKILLVFAISLNAYFCFSQTNTVLWNKNEREYLVTRLKDLQNLLQKEVEFVNNKQLNFKPEKSKWSIAEVLEHIGVYEELLYWDLLNNQYTEERPDLVENSAYIDSAMVAYATDPNNGQAPFSAKPLGRFKSKIELLNYNNLFRNEVINLIQSTTTNFRLHFIFRPKDWGIWHKRDLHQYTLLWIAHCERHINQIKKIKSAGNFPK